MKYFPDMSDEDDAKLTPLPRATMNPSTERDEMLRKIRDTLTTMTRMDRSEASATDGYANIYINHVTYLLSLLDSQAAGSASPTTPLLQKIVEVADLGSAQEFGDALERLRAIRGLIVGENV